MSLCESYWILWKSVLQEEKPQLIAQDETTKVFIINIKDNKRSSTTSSQSDLRIRNEKMSKSAERIMDACHVVSLEKIYFTTGGPAACFGNRSGSKIETIIVLNRLID